MVISLVLFQHLVSLVLRGEKFKLDVGRVRVQNLIDQTQLIASLVQILGKLCSH